jgi:hypothetical protein
MYGWLISRRHGDLTGLEMGRLFPKVDLSKLSCEGNGKRSLVVQAEIPVRFIRREDIETWRKTLLQVRDAAALRRRISANDILKTATFEIRCMQNVPKTLIKAVWAVRWGENWAGSIHNRTYALQRIYQKNGGDRR